MLAACTVQELLDDAQVQLTEGAARLCMPVQLIRKTRSVGVVPTQPTIYEVLEELAISVQTNLISNLPFCAFNGGNDVFVDVGNKSIGLDALMRHLDCYPQQVTMLVMLVTTVNTVQHQPGRPLALHASPADAQGAHCR